MEREKRRAHPPIPDQTGFRVGCARARGDIQQAVVHRFHGILSGQMLVRSGVAEIISHVQFEEFQVAVLDVEEHGIPQNAEIRVGGNAQLMRNLPDSHVTLPINLAGRSPLVRLSWQWDQAWPYGRIVSTRPTATGRGKPQTELHAE